MLEVRGRAGPIESTGEFGLLQITNKDRWGSSVSASESVWERELTFAAPVSVAIPCEGHRRGVRGLIPVGRYIVIPATSGSWMDLVGSDRDESVGEASSGTSGWNPGQRVCGGPPVEPLAPRLSHAVASNM